jgi:hypothetical protein
VAEEGNGDETWLERVRLTDWGIIAPGEGGNKVASLFFSTRDNETIGNRILLINTAESDIIKAAKAVDERIESEHAKASLTNIMRNNKVIFGEGRGAGNFWPEGENSIKENFDGDEEVRRRIEGVGLSACPAVCDIFTLGGGTGCGSGPYIIYRTKKDEVIHGKHFAIAIWPEMRDGGQRHFNAIGGFSRLIEYEGEQNADLIILISNEYLAKSISEDKVKGKEDRYFQMNNVIADLIEMMIAPGRTESDVTIEISDYTTWPAAVGVYHAVPCLSMGNDTELIGLEAALDDAVSKALFPMDAKTATMVWAIFRVPQDYYGVDEFEPVKMNEIFDNWTEEHIIGEVKYVAVTYDKNLKETFDVLLLLGGPNIDITKSYHLYEKFKKTLSRGSENIILPGRGGKIILPVKTLDTLEKTLNDYLKHTVEVQETLGGGEL